MSNSTQLQKIKARLKILTGKVNKYVDDNAYSIYKLSGESELGKPYQYDVTFASPFKLEVEELIDNDVRVLLQDEKDFTQKREIFGKIYAAVAQDRVADKHLYTLTVVHPLHYLNLNKRYEIFQEKSAYDIIKEILDRYKALLHIKMGSNIAPHIFIKREYCTQYGISDLAFIQLLAQEEGITLLMQSDAATPYNIRLAHINETYNKLDNELRCSYTQSKTFAPTNITEDYYDFRVPSKQYKSNTGKEALSQSLKDNTKSAQLRHDIEFITHKDRLEVDRSKDIKNSIKQQSLTNYSNAEKIVGKSQSLYTTIGHGGTLFDHKAVKRVEAILTKVQYEGLFPNALDEHIQDKEVLEQYVFECHFEATPVATIYIPPYNIVKPLIPSSVTAIVSSGSRDTESTPNTIDVDNLGRVRVLFHFEQKHTASCYIRFANFSSGDGWGSQFIPRVNTEVIVNFLNGDPDRPVCIGSLYNGNNKIPKDLPNNKTQSYIKTQSMPGSNSEYNLLLFEDKAQEELVHIRAQKDYKLHALHNSYINIDNDQTEVVGHDESVSIGNDRTKSIGHDETTDVGNDRTESVGRDETISIGKDQTLTVGHDQNIEVKNTQANKIDKDKFTIVGNHRKDKTHANHDVTTGGHFTHTTNGKRDIKAGTHIKSITKLHEMHGSDRIVFKSKGGTIIIDGGGITLKGNVQIKGNVAISGGSGGGASAAKMRVNKGEPFCMSCFLKSMGIDG